jgi:hypothetical protein
MARNPQTVARLARRNGGTVALGAAVAAASAASLADMTNLLINRSQYVNQFQNSILYPPDLLRAGEDVPFISMQFEQYERRSINTQPFYREVMKIRLPIPDNLIERTAVTYNKQELGSVVGSVTQGLAGVAGNPGIGSIIQGVVGAASGVGTVALRAAAQEAAGVVGITPGQVDTAIAGLASLTGITANPFEVILFKSPQFRTHRFYWKFIPNDLQETELLRTLVENFKYHSLPGISAAGAVFFSYPEILKINFQPSDRYLYKFKPCVVDSVTVNYAPNGPSFIRESKAPTAIQFEIQLQEIEIMTKADFLRDNRGGFTSWGGVPLQGSNPNGAE